MAITPPSTRRILHFGDQGVDVLAYQRAVRKTLHQLGLASTNRRSGLYGDGTLSDTLRLQRRLRLDVDGKVGVFTWTAIDPQLDAYGKFLLRLKVPQPTPAGQRVAHEARVLATFAPRHYTQARPYAGTLDAWRANGGDCSGTAILIYKLAGLPDPNGTGYDGSGYTGSLDKRGVRVATADYGDLTFYGQTVSTHVTIAIGNGQCVSHGSEGGPYTLPINYRGDYLQTRRYV